MQAKYFEVQSCWPESAFSAEREWYKHAPLSLTRQQAEEYKRQLQQRAKWTMAVFRIVEVEQ